MTDGAGPPLPSLIALNRALQAQQLLRGVAHDLRNNLQVVALGSSLGAEGQGSAVAVRVERSLEEMVGSLELLSHLGRATVDEPASTDLGGAFDDIRILADLQRNVATLRLRIDPPTTPTVVAVPKTAVQQMLLNLIINAKEAGARATDPVTLTVTMPMAGRVAIVIADVGAGMPSEAGTLYFSTKDRGSHGGLGLFVTRALAEQYDGELVWESGAAGGTRVRLILPVTGRG